MRCLECSGKGCQHCKGTGETVMHIPPKDFALSIVSACLEKNKTQKLDLAEKLVLSAMLDSLV